MNIRALGSTPRIVGPAVRAFEAEVEAESNGEEWGPEDRDKWRWRPVPINGPDSGPITNRVNAADLEPLVAESRKRTRPPVNQNILRKK